MLADLKRLRSLLHEAITNEDFEPVESAVEILDELISKEENAKELSDAHR